MRSLKVLGIILCVCAFGLMATAADNNMGIHEVSQITFVAPVRIGSSVLPAGDYQVRHIMDGQDHVMVFQLLRGKSPEVKVKCMLVQLGKKADQTRTVYELNAQNERVLQELVFRGDTAKHVF